jgi:hypothetical protein
MEQPVKPQVSGKGGVKRNAKGQIMKGASLNPGGRPRDTPTRWACQQHLYRCGPELVDKAVEYALGGDKRMLRFLLEKLVPNPAPAQVSDGPESTKQEGRAWTVEELRKAQRRVN